MNKYLRQFLLLSAILVAAISTACSSKQENTTVTDIYLDESASIETRVEDLLSKLTVEEKISLMRSTAPAVERLGLDKYYHGNEALHGIIRPGRFTVYPQAIALASMWDPALVEEISGTISDEAGPDGMPWIRDARRHLLLRIS